MSLARPLEAFPIERNQNFPKVVNGVVPGYTCLLNPTQMAMLARRNTKYLWMQQSQRKGRDLPVVVRTLCVSCLPSPGRERISSKNVAHIMNNEAQRKYLVSVKRLMTYLQDKRTDVAPSKKVR